MKYKEFREIIMQNPKELIVSLGENHERVEFLVVKII